MKMCEVWIADKRNWKKNYRPSAYHGVAGTWYLAARADVTAATMLARGEAVPLAEVEDEDAMGASMHSTIRFRSA